MKKLLIYTDCIFFAGCENVLENILSYHQITERYNIVLYYRYTRRYQEELENRSINIETIPCRILTNDDLIVILQEKFGKSVFYKICLLPFWLIEKLYIYHFVNFFLLKNILKKENPDIIHINNGGYPGAESCRTMVVAAVFSGVKSILFTINNMAIKSRGILDRYLDRLINNHVSNFVTASKAASHRLSKERRFSEKKLEVIHNTVLHDASIKNYSPVLRSEFKVDRDHCIIGSLGLLIERKGYHCLIEAASYIKNRENWSIYIFGEGEERDNLEALIRKHDLSENIYLPGFRVNPIEYLLDFDVFILPSIYNEDQPNVINEAMLFSKPVISTYVAGIPEQIDDQKTGFLCKPGSVSELSEALKEMILMKDKERKIMGEKGFDRYGSQFSYEVSMKKYLNLYNQLSKN